MVGIKDVAKAVASVFYSYKSRDFQKFDRIPLHNFRRGKRKCQNAWTQQGRGVSMEDHYGKGMFRIFSGRFRAIP